MAQHGSKRMNRNVYDFFSPGLEIGTRSPLPYSIYQRMAQDSLDSRGGKIRFYISMGKAIKYREE